MRIAVLSDVHGNAPALAAVLADIDGHAPDVVVDLGDLLSGWVDPRGTLDLLGEHAPIIHLRGNHDRLLLDDDPADADAHAAAALTDADRGWLASHPSCAELAEGVFAVHATPSRDDVFLLESVDADATNGWRPATDYEIEGRLDGLPEGTEVLLCGHTHTARVRKLPGGPLIINPGSVGLPAMRGEDPTPYRVEAGDPRARYALLTTDEHAPAGWRVDLIAVDYETDRAASLARAVGRDDVAYAIETGRVREEPDGGTDASADPAADAGAARSHVRRAARTVGRARRSR